MHVELAYFYVDWELFFIVFVELKNYFKIISNFVCLTFSFAFSVLDTDTEKHSRKNIKL